MRIEYITYIQFTRHNNMYGRKLMNRVGDDENENPSPNIIS